MSITELADKIEQVSSTAHLELLIAVIARGNALDHLRRMEAKRRGSGKIESIEGHDPPSPGDPLSEIDKVELAQLLSEAMGKISERDRQVFRAFHLERMTYEEIARQFQMLKGTVGAILSRALEALEEELERRPKLMRELLELLL